MSKLVTEQPRPYADCVVDDIALSSGDTPAQILERKQIWAQNAVDHIVNLVTAKKYKIRRTPNTNRESMLVSVDEAFLDKGSQSFSSEKFALIIDTFEIRFQNKRIEATTFERKWTAHDVLLISGLCALGIIPACCYWGHEDTIRTGANWVFVILNKIPCART